MEVKYGVYKVVGSKSELVIAYGEPHVPMRTRRKYAGKKAKIKAIEQLTGNVMVTILFSAMTILSAVFQPIK